MYIGIRPIAAESSVKGMKSITNRESAYFGLRTKRLHSVGSTSSLGRETLLRKRDFRKLWIARINAGCRQNGINYSKFMHGLNLLGITLNRKVLSDMAINDAAGFAALVDQVKAKLA